MVKPKTLNIKDAIELYLALHSFVPEYESDDDYLEFTGTIISNIKNSDKPETFGQVILLMYPKMTPEKLVKMKPFNVIKLFMEGLVHNKFFLLMKFCGVLGYG